MVKVKDRWAFQLLNILFKSSVVLGTQCPKSNYLVFVLVGIFLLFFRASRPVTTLKCSDNNICGNKDY